MTPLTWDQVGERRYETGIDRGVLYPIDAPAVPWNGLVSINEITGREVKPFYLDGMNYLNQPVLGSYAAKIQAITYPDELDALLGMVSYAAGVRVHDQRPRPFHLSYRTKVGNDVDGMDHGYKIHVLYNVLAIPNDSTIGTTSNSPAPTPFEWTLLGTPDRFVGFNPLSTFRPTGHISFDSRLLSPSALAVVEATLYGSEIEDPSVPSADLFVLLAATS